MHLPSLLILLFMIIRFHPTQEEKEMYKKYCGDKAQLPVADTFLLKVKMFIIEM